MTAPVTQERGSGRRDGTRIAMTAPVAQERTSDGWTVSFVMPSGSTIRDLPKPDDPRVVLREVPARRIAAVTFSGTWSAGRFEAKEASLRQMLAAAGLITAGPAVYARYNPPWTPWFMRRNEILVPLAEPPAGSAR